ncbi:hypothetical protein ACFPZP_09300 [Citrobacter bitternis]|uniref:Uncharacterized protein n=1 Tax=Citrobacter bitternis TaxID=1585982 RepID=A0ABW1PYG3_9ENTR
MKDISITDYLGPGVYLLCNYPQESGALIAEKGYKVCYCEDVAHLADVIDDNKADFILISDNEGKFEEYIDVIRLSAQSSVKKIAIDILVTESQREFYFNFVKVSHRLGYRLDSSFYLLNPGYNSSFNSEQHLRMVLSFGQGQLNELADIPGENEITRKNITKALPYVRPGDRVLVISESDDSANDIKCLLLEQTKASVVQVSSLDNIDEALFKELGYHFIVVDKYSDDDLIKSLGNITARLLPAGRYFFLKINKEIIYSLENLNVQPEVYFIYEHGNLKAKIHYGEDITPSPELCVFMKNPLEKTSMIYEETIYGYPSPPKNLLAFARDYTHPWLIRGIVEFPFRNHSAYHLKQYSRQILHHYDPRSPDYAAALAVLGYQLLSNGDDAEEILAKILNYCSEVLKLAKPSPHQYRWYISLSTLLGLIYNRNDDKIKALIHFSNAANSCVEKFSPSIGTKILQSLYMQSVILISLNKISCAEITIERGIKRGIHLFYHNSEELVGKVSQPFNFVLFIYHDIIDWIIKLVNIKNAIPSRKFNILSNDNNNTWSALLHERMNAINNMSQMIDERDNTIRLQTGLIDERDNMIAAQENLINERDNEIAAQKNLINERDIAIAAHKNIIEERDNVIATQKELINERGNAIAVQKDLIDERDNAIALQKDLIDERDNAIAAQKGIIGERDNAVAVQKSVIDEREKAIHQQNQVIEGLQEVVSTKEQKIAELLHKNDEIIALNDEKELHMAQLSADLERARSTLRKINSTPVIGLLLRILNIK